MYIKRSLEAGIKDMAEHFLSFWFSDCEDIGFDIIDQYR